MSIEKYEKWRPLTTEDLEAYFGFCIHMGITSVTRGLLEEKDPVYHYAPIAYRISRD